MKFLLLLSRPSFFLLLLFKQRVLPSVARGCRDLLEGAVTCQKVPLSILEGAAPILRVPLPVEKGTLAARDKF